MLFNKVVVVAVVAGRLHVGRYVPGVVQIGPVCTGLLCMPEDLTGSLDIA